jgi:hypothetical protein
MIAGFNDLTYYEILDISPGVEAKEIQEGYYRVREIFARNSLASYSLYTEPEREEIQRIIEDAYRVLIDQKSREAYDRQLHLERVKTIRAGKALQEALPLMPREAGAADGPEAPEPASLPVGQEGQGEGRDQEEMEKEDAGAGPRPPSAPPLPSRPARITAAEDKDEEIEEAVAQEREERDKVMEGPDEGPAPEPGPARPAALPPSPEAAAKTMEPAHGGSEAPAGPGADDKASLTAAPLSAKEQAAPAPSAPGPSAPAGSAVVPAPARDKTPAPAPASPAALPHRPGRPWERDHKPLPGAAPITPAGVKRSELKPPLSARGREPFEDTVYDVPAPPAKACPMDYVETGVSGKFFRERREARGLTLDKVWETTKIRRPILEAIEREEYDRLPAAVFLKGMLLSYARVLGLEDPEAAIKGYIERMTSAKQWID